LFSLILLPRVISEMPDITVCFRSLYSIISNIPFSASQKNG
jgi:phenolic acid decarboxylase